MPAQLITDNNLWVIKKNKREEKNIYYDYKQEKNWIMVCNLRRSAWRYLVVEALYGLVYRKRKESISNGMWDNGKGIHAETMKLAKDRIVWRMVVTRLPHW